MTTWRLVDTGALSGALNMAIDQTLLEMHARGESPPTLRFYQWNPRAISIGALQKPGFDVNVCRSLGLNIIQRPTGGRAVLHQDDLTYSVIAGVQEGIPMTLAAAYDLICQGLMTGLRLLGIEAALGQETARADQPEVCFLRSRIGDIVYQGKKFVGSAQTWLGSSLLQHGSILLKPQLQTWASLMGADSGIHQCSYEGLKNRMTSLVEILGHVPPLNTIKAVLTTGMAQQLGAVIVEEPLTSSEWSHAQEMAEQRYGFSRQDPGRRDDLKHAIAQYCGKGN